MTNNIMVKSGKVRIDLSFSIDKSKYIPKSKPKTANGEVFAVGLSGSLYRIKTFTEKLPVFDMHGYGLMLFKSKAGYVVYLEQFEEQNLYSLPAIFKTDIKKTPERFCLYDYIDKKTEMRIIMDFEAETLRVDVNGNKCIEYRIDTRFFPEPKMAFTLAGYSSKSSLVQMQLHETSIYKSTITAAKEFDSVFHNDVDTFMNHIEMYDPLHSKNASFSNVILTQVSSLGQTKQGDRQLREPGAHPRRAKQDR